MDQSTMKSLPIPQPQTALTEIGWANRLAFFAFIFFLLLSFTSEAQSIQFAWDYDGSVCPAALAGPFTFNLYRATSAGGPYTKQNASPITATTYADTGSLITGIPYFYVVKTSCAGTESTPTNEIRNAPILPAPLNLRATCAASGTSATISWTNAAGAQSIFLRVKQPDGLERPYDAITGTSKVETILPSQTYQMWAHSYSSTAGMFNSGWGAGIGPGTNSVSFNCVPNVTPPATNLRITITSPTPLTPIAWNKQTVIRLQAENATRQYLFIDNMQTYRRAVQCTDSPCELTQWWRPGSQGEHTIKGLAFDAENNSVPVTMTVTAR